MLSIQNVITSWCLLAQTRIWRCKENDEDQVVVLVVGGAMKGLANGRGRWDNEGFGEWTDCYIPCTSLTSPLSMPALMRRRCKHHHRHRSVYNCCSHKHPRPHPRVRQVDRGEDGAGVDAEWVDARGRAAGRLAGSLCE
eukprot:346478-Chlamydomonas_euryale.AAC.1